MKIPISLRMEESVHSAAKREALKLGITFGQLVENAVRTALPKKAK